jgi:menaquinone-specific isochorismate synthase
VPAESVNTIWSSLDLGSDVQFETSWGDVVDWFKQIDCYPKLIWKGRECSTVYFCVGMSLSHPKLPTFTVRAFDTTQPQWDGFPSTLKWTPFGVVEWHSEENSSCKLYKSTHQHQWCHSKGHTQIHRAHRPNLEQWVTNINKSKQLFHDTTLRKIVLARESYFDPPDPWIQFVKLKNSQPNNYHFLFSPQPNTIFLGASPEKLFSQTGSILKTEALAGTRSVSHDQSENEFLRQELNQSSKDQTEHHIVVHYIHTQLKDLCVEQRSMPQEVLQLPDVQHLRTPIECKLHPNTTTDQLLERLHPTPAVCGIPKRISNQLIAELEPFHRGWYAGTMGIEHNNNSDFTVMIRSALWRDDAGYAWSGAGIVSESDANLEWIEIENKAKQFIQQEST